MAEAARIRLGILDTGLFIHPLFRRDPQAPRCLAILEALERDAAEGWLDITVVHELTYALRVAPGFTRAAGGGRTEIDRGVVHAYLRPLLLLDGIRADDRDGLVATLDRWATTGVAFVDAWLMTLAIRRHLPVCSPNAADFADVANTFAGPAAPPLHP
jgi:predicted nucleic acid-binding protein